MKSPDFKDPLREPRKSGGQGRDTERRNRKSEQSRGGRGVRDEIPVSPSPPTSVSPVQTDFRKVHRNAHGVRKIPQ